MFDISFSELAMCFVVALVVLGPERLPKLAKTLGRWSGKARGYMRNLTAELERESDLADLKRQFEEARDALKETKTDFERSTRQLGSDVKGRLEPTPEEAPKTRSPEDLPAAAVTAAGTEAGVTPAESRPAPAPEVKLPPRALAPGERPRHPAEPPLPTRRAAKAEADADVAPPVASPESAPAAPVEPAADDPGKPSP